jgi:hypothetical protein
MIPTGLVSLTIPTHFGVGVRKRINPFVKPRNAKRANGSFCYFPYFLALKKIIKFFKIPSA